MALQPDLRGLAHTQGHMVGSIHSSNHLDRERVALPGPPPVRALHDGTADPRAGLECTGTKFNDQTMSSLQRSLQPLFAAITSLQQPNISAASAISSCWQQLHRSSDDFLQPSVAATTSLQSM